MLLKYNNFPQTVNQPTGPRRRRAHLSAVNPGRFSAISMAVTIFGHMSQKATPSGPPFVSVIANLPPSVPFVAPEALERRYGNRIHLRLGANESAFGTSPSALAAMRDAAGQSNWYGDPESHDLRSVLAVSNQISPDNIVIGNGIDGLLGYIVHAFVDPGTSVVTTLGTYPTFNYHVVAHGGTLHRVPYRDDRADLQALLDSAKSNEARLVYLANPDNPSGSWHRANDIDHFISELPENCMLVVDEAYFEFAPEDAVPTIDAEWQNIIRVRTFSKAHGMAGARIGYAIGHADVVSTIGKFRNQFEVSRVSQAGALASLADHEFVQSVIRDVESGRRDYVALASQLRLPTIPSATNFVCFDIGGPDRARAIVDALLTHGVFIRMPGAPPLDRCVRVTVGTPSERAEFAEIFSDVIKRV
jgi:histidinol-phosphate aminotransferase